MGRSVAEHQELTARSLRRAGLAVLLLPLAAGPALAQTNDWRIGPFVKPPGLGPILTPDSAATFYSVVGDSTVHWEANATFNPAAVVKGGKVYVLYRAEDASGAATIGGHTSRLGLAESADGLHFTRRATPVLYPDTDAQRANEWPGGVEDPRIVEREDGTYVLTYTQWNRDVPRLAVATSQDLVTWHKHGPAFAHAAGGRYLRAESKAGAILCRVVGDDLIATKVAGKYWMYWGVPELRLATSDNLLDWTPIEDASGNAVSVLAPRRAYFDACLVEAGAPARPPAGSRRGRTPGPCSTCCSAPRDTPASPRARPDVRILVAHNVPRRRPGGPMRIMEFLHRPLAALGHEVDFLCSEDVAKGGRASRLVFPWVVRERAVQAAAQGKPYDIVNVHEAQSALIATVRGGAGDPGHQRDQLRRANNGDGHPAEPAPQHMGHQDREEPDRVGRDRALPHRRRENRGRQRHHHHHQQR